jgi:hypothetical protein
MKLLFKWLRGLYVQFVVITAPVATATDSVAATTVDQNCCSSGCNHIQYYSPAGL